MKIEIACEEEKYKVFSKILENNDQSLSEILNLMIEKTLKENSIDWLYISTNGEVRTKNIKTKTAIQLFRKKGYSLNIHNTNFASKTNRNNYYWINPDVRHLKEEWYIILNDYVNKTLYLFNVPKNSISNLKMRNDRICNVSIRYDDINFLDINSSICFSKYLLDAIKYDSLVK